MLSAPLGDMTRLRREGVKLLIVDDSKIVADRLAAFIQERSPASRIVGHARDGVQALEYIQDLQPDVIILDIQMPGRSGIEVLRDVKAMPAPPVVIILTNYPLPQYRKRCMEEGADYFFDKSTQFEEIPRVLDVLIRRAPDRKNGGRAEVSTVPGHDSAGGYP